MVIGYGITWGAMMTVVVWGTVPVLYPDMSWAGGAWGAPCWKYTVPGGRAAIWGAPVAAGGYAAPAGIPGAGYAAPGGAPGGG